MEKLEMMIKVRNCFIKNKIDSEVLIYFADISKDIVFTSVNSKLIESLNESEKKIFFENIDGIKILHSFLKELSVAISE